MNPKTIKIMFVCMWVLIATFFFSLMVDDTELRDHEFAIKLLRKEITVINERLEIIDPDYNSDAKERRN
jgi:hypothetical protein